MSSLDTRVYGYAALLLSRCRRTQRMNDGTSFDIAAATPISTADCGSIPPALEAFAVLETQQMTI